MFIVEKSYREYGCAYVWVFEKCPLYTDCPLVETVTS